MRLYIPNREEVDDLLAMEESQARMRQGQGGRGSCRVAGQGLAKEDEIKRPEAG